MGKYMRKCKLMGDVAVMEVAHHQVGVRTRARTLAMAAASASAAAAAKKRKIDSGELQLPSSSYSIQLRSRRRNEIPPDNSELAQKSKIDSGEVQLPSLCDIQLTTRRRLEIEPENPNSKSPVNSESSDRVLLSTDRCSSPNSDNLPASRCSSNGSSMLMKEKLMKSVVDLEGDGSEIENSTNFDRRERRETTPSSNLRAESDDLESTEGLPMRNSLNISTEKKMMPSEAEIDDFFSVAEKEEQKRFEKKYNFDFVKEVPLEGRYEWVSLIQ